eukprot:NODE_14109_length_1128_cov_2.065934.p4 GENE.NODE_14109_length_1128_cov_2.065934~~NODE_14109_length_1128_cov_2.065934.p4  ORF type:complete len:124 (-),score=56.73 NODE_14109_length_1128_cov_2.065934:391-762(-)
MSQEKQQEIREQHEVRAQEEGRTAVGSSVYSGTLVNWRSSFGWIKPTSAAQLPVLVRKKLTDMAAARKAKMEAAGRVDKADADHIYVRVTDLVDSSAAAAGRAVRFRLYMDKQGVGAFDVVMI